MYIYINTVALKWYPRKTLSLKRMHLAASFLYRRRSKRQEGERERDRDKRKEEREEAALL